MTVDILVPFMVYYLVADIGMPVVIADVFDGISFITGFGCEKFVNQEVKMHYLTPTRRITFFKRNNV